MGPYSKKVYYAGSFLYIVTSDEIFLSFLIYKDELSEKSWLRLSPRVIPTTYSGPWAIKQKKLQERVIYQ